MIEKPSNWQVKDAIYDARFSVLYVSFDYCKYGMPHRKKNYGTMYLRLNQGLHVMRTAVTWLRIGTFIAHDKVRQVQHWSKLSGLHAIPIELMQVAMI